MSEDAKVFLVSIVLIAVLLFAGIVGATVYNIHKIDQCTTQPESAALIAMCK